MNEAQRLHRQAMDLYDRAQLAEANGHGSESHDMFRQAYELESKAASIYRDRHEVEPTRSILLKGAAVMALRCGLSGDAEKLAHAGLAGDPPANVAVQLWAVLKEAARLTRVSRRPRKTRQHPQEISVEGTLQKADSSITGGPGKVFIVDENGDGRWMQVPASRIDAVVGPHFHRRVRATGRRAGGFLVLEDISPVPQDV